MRAAQGRPAQLGVAIQSPGTVHHRRHLEYPKRANMFAFFFRPRRQRRYVWTPAVDFSNRGVIAALMTFGH